MSQNIQSCYNYYRCHSRRPIITSSGLRSLIKRGLTSLTSYVQNLTLLKKWEKTFLQQPRFFFIEGDIVRMLILIKQVLLIHSFISSFILPRQHWNFAPFIARMGVYRKTSALADLPLP